MALAATWLFVMFSMEKTILIFNGNEVAELLIFKHF